MDDAQTVTLTHTEALALLTWLDKLLEHLT